MSEACRRLAGQGSTAATHDRLSGVRQPVAQPPLAMVPRTVPPPPRVVPPPPPPPRAEPVRRNQRVPPPPKATTSKSKTVPVHVEVKGEASMDVEPQPPTPELR